ncbi:hypothetical protein AAC387_Pa01g1388 [Persea americana]
MKRKRGGKKCTINGGVQLSLNSSGSRHILEVFRQAALVISTPDLVELQSVAISGFEGHWIWTEFHVSSLNLRRVLSNSKAVQGYLLEFLLCGDYTPPGPCRLLLPLLLLSLLFEGLDRFPVLLYVSQDYLKRQESK